VDTLRRSLDRVPVRQGKDISITGDDLLAAVTTALKDFQWEQLRAALGGLLAGDTTVLQRLLGSAEATPGIADKAFWAISCLSAPLAPRFTSAEVKAALPQFLSASPQFGEFYAKHLMQCAHWPVPPRQPAHTVSAPGAAPILVVGTTRDPCHPVPVGQVARPPALLRPSAHLRRRRASRLPARQHLRRHRRGPLSDTRPAASRR
jgi:hypothetical protein